MDDDPLQGLGLRQVKLTDQETLAPYFAALAEPLSDYTFSQLFTWGNSLRILWKEIDGHLCVFANGTGDLTLLLPPLGEGNSTRALAAAFDVMDQYNEAHAVRDRSRVEYVSEELLPRFDRTGLNIQPLGADYLYDVNRMIDLAGGDLASKRQAKNRFLRNYAHRVEPYMANRHKAACLALLDSWKEFQDQHHHGDGSNQNLKRLKESLACQLALENADALGMRGMVVYVANPDGGESLRGFTFGEFLGKDQTSIVIEKTDLQIKGLAQFIFSEFCRAYWADRPLVNAGDDWGLESLAWTKMSYRPVKLLQKYVMSRIAPVQIAVPAPMTAVPAAAAVDIVEPSPIFIRPAVREDLPAAVELEHRCFSTYCLSKRQLQYLHRSPNSVFVVAEQNGRIVGDGIALIRHHRGGVTGRIYSLAVDAPARGQRIGQKLMREILAALAARGVRRAYLEVEKSNAAATHLYEQLGFRPIGTLPDYYGDTRDGIHMLCEIQSPSTLFDVPATLSA